MSLSLLEKQAFLAGVTVGANKYGFAVFEAIAAVRNEEWQSVEQLLNELAMLMPSEKQIHDRASEELEKKYFQKFDPKIE